MLKDPHPWPPGTGFCDVHAEDLDEMINKLTALRALGWRDLGHMIQGRDGVYRQKMAHHRLPTTGKDL